MNKHPFKPIERERVTLSKKVTDRPNIGCDPKNQFIDDRIKTGLVIVNKPAGPTSHQVSAYVRDIFGLTTSGHSGTLDPNVTGVLPVALENGTKCLQALLQLPKEYVCYMRIHKPVDAPKIEQVCSSFIGVISQLPPLKSAVKRQVRQREIYYLDILEIDGQDVLFRVGCQAGTYIRKLCTDIGEKLGCGAHMQQLIRTRAGSFTLDDTYTLDQIKDAFEFYKDDGDDTKLKTIIRPNTDFVMHLPKLWVYDEAIYSLTHGAPLAIPGVFSFEKPFEKDQIVTLLSQKNELIALAKTTMDVEQFQKDSKGILATLVRVIMADDIYPKLR